MFKKGVLPDVFRLKEPHPGTLAVQQIVSEGPSPLLCHPLLHIETCLLGNFAHILRTISHKVVGAATSKTILGLLLVQLHCISKMDNVADWLICSTKTTGGFLVFCRRLNFLLSFRHGIQVFFHFIALQGSQTGSEGLIAL